MLFQDKGVETQQNVLSILHLHISVTGSLNFLNFKMNLSAVPWNAGAAWGPLGGPSGGPPGRVGGKEEVDLVGCCPEGEVY